MSQIQQAIFCLAEKNLHLTAETPLMTQFTQSLAVPGREQEEAQRDCRGAIADFRLKGKKVQVVSISLYSYFSFILLRSLSAEKFDCRLAIADFRFLCVVSFSLFLCGQLRKRS
jgi:hypothetical protein